MRYLHERPDWPDFRWDSARLTEVLADARYRQGLLLGRMGSLDAAIRAEAGLETLRHDVVASSAIEGERLDAAQVRSALARRLGLDPGGPVPATRSVEGIVDMVLDATQRYEEPLSAERLWGWHAALFSGRYGVAGRIRAGAWRTEEDGPMQIVSGYIGREKVHYEAPAAARLDEEMQRFFDWFNAPSGMDPVLKAGLAHLWFVSIHPFGDGNGRIARAIADCALARSDKSPLRFYSMSRQIALERTAYYEILESSEKGEMDITSWLCWFVGCLGRAIDGAETVLAATLRRARVWQHAEKFPLNERQRRVIGRLLDNFQGKLTSGKYAKLAKCSSDTALRDIRALMEYGVLEQMPGGGRSTSYALIEHGEGREA